MTVDREQIRRDAEWLATTGPHVWPDRAESLGRDISALFAELQQAEKERDDLRVARDTYKATAIWHADKHKNAEARLAKVPALVELLRGHRDYFVGYDLERTDGKSSPAIAKIDEALTKWERE